MSSRASCEATANVEEIRQLSLALTKEAFASEAECLPSVERNLDILNQIQEHVTNLGVSKRTKSTSQQVVLPTTNMTMAAILEKTQIGKVLSKTVRSFKRHARTSAGEEKEAWDELVRKSSDMVSILKETVSKEEEERLQKENKGERVKQEPRSNSTSSATNIFPSSVSEYKHRLVSHKKDLYKDPPVLPPAGIVVSKRRGDLPSRKGKKGIFIFEDQPDFTPNRSPEEVLRAGSFGGTYFRPITSAVTNVRYKSSDVLKETVQPSWIEGLNKAATLTSSNYDISVNKYGVKCGGSLGMWESSGWITEVDPYGWFQWYCRFFQGRRCTDDERQISRWNKSVGPKGRFRSQLCNKCIAQNAKADDKRISPVIRQTMLHWGIELTEDLLKGHKKRTGR